MGRNKTSQTGSDPCDNRDPATSALNEWGIPDWRDKTAYGDTENWSLGRWRWEFFRRRDDVRAMFEGRKNDQYEDSLERWKADCARPELTQSERNFILEKAPNKPESHKFWVHLSAKEQERFGYQAIPNPRIGDISAFSDQVDRLDSYDWAVNGERGGTTLPRAELQKHHLVIAFSTDRPLAKQIRDATAYLKGLQKYRHGRNLKKPRHREKWLEYLRTLDAFEVNAPWIEIAALRSNSAQTEGTARDTREQAKALCFNF